MLASNLQNEAPLQIQPDRLLSFAVAFQPFEVQRFYRVKVSFIPKSANLLHAFSVSTHNFLRKPGSELGIRLQAVQIVVVEFNFHR